MSLFLKSMVQQAITSLSQELIFCSCDDFKLALWDNPLDITNVFSILSSFSHARIKDKK